RVGAVIVLAEIVRWRAVFVDGRPAGNDVGVTLEDVVGILSLDPIKQGGVAVHVVEVFQHAVPVGLCQIRIGLGLGHGGGHFNCHLFIADGGLKRRKIR